MESGKESGYRLEEYFRVILKRLGILIGIFAFVVTGVAIFSFKVTPVYRASALLQIEKRRSSVVDIQDVYQLDTRPDDYYQTQYRLLKSRTICRQAFENLGLDKSAKYADSKNPLGNFIDDIIVEPVPDTYLVRVSYESENPELAASVANAVADGYMTAVNSEKKAISSEAEQKIITQIPILRQKLTESQTALRQFEEEDAAVSFQKRREIIYATLSSLSAQLTKTNQEIAAAKAITSSIESAKTDKEILSLPEVVKSPTIQGFQKEKLLIEAEKANLAHKYEVDSRQIKAIDSKIDAVKLSIREEALRIVESLKTELAKKKTESEELKTLLNAQEEMARAIDAKMYRYDSLRAEVEGNRKLYEEFVQRQKELQSASQFDPGTVQIVDRAEVPKIPARPKKTQNILVAAALSLLTGIGLAFLFEHLDNSIKNTEDIDRYVKLPVLGIVPKFKTDKGAPAEKDLFVHRKPKSNISEAYRSIRTSLAYASPNQDAKAYVITSACPQEGKTITAINLAITLAYAGKKVLLVDSDLRKPRIHKPFQIDGGRGLTNYLVGQSPAEDLTVDTEIENLFIMPSGPIPPNPAELLSSTRMKELIVQMKKKYDAVILDSSPLVAVTDGAELAAISDGAIQVIWGGYTSRKVVQMGKEKIEGIGAKIVGIILNNIRVSRGGYYYYYPRYYTYYGVHEELSSKK